MRVLTSTGVSHRREGTANVAGKLAFLFGPFKFYFSSLLVNTMRACQCSRFCTKCMLVDLLGSCFSCIALPLLINVVFTRVYPFLFYFFVFFLPPLETAAHLLLALTIITALKNRIPDTVSHTVE